MKRIAFKFLFYFLLAPSFLGAMEFSHPSSNEMFESHPVSLTFQGAYTQLSVGEEMVASYALRPNVHMFLTDWIGVDFGYYSVSNIKTGKTLLNGFDGGFRFYLFSFGRPKYLKKGSVVMESRANFTHYLLASIRSKTLIGNSSIGYNGYAGGYGADYRIDDWGTSSMWDKKLLNFEFTQEKLTSFGAGNLLIRNYSFGIGTLF